MEKHLTEGIRHEKHLLECAMFCLRRNMMSQVPIVTLCIVNKIMFFYQLYCRKILLENKTSA